MERKYYCKDRIICIDYVVGSPGGVTAWGGPAGADIYAYRLLIFRKRNSLTRNPYALEPSDSRRTSTHVDYTQAPIGETSQIGRARREPFVYTDSLIKSRISRRGALETATFRPPSWAFYNAHEFIRIHGRYRLVGCI